MRIDEVIPGSKIDWCGIPAWYLGKINDLDYGDNYLIGWRPGEQVSHGWPLHEHGNLAARIMLEKAGCERGWFMSKFTEVTLINEARVANKSPGMSCRLCRDFSPMAEANRPDGVSFICFPCRQGWIPSGY